MITSRLCSTRRLAFLDHHFGDLDVARCRLVEGRGNDLALHRALHVGDFFRPLVDQKHDQIAFRMIGAIALAMFCRMTVLPVRGGGDQRALAHALRRHDVDHAARLVLDGRIVELHIEPARRIERRQIVEMDLVLDLLGVLEIDRGDLEQREIALAVLGAADRAFDRIAGAQAEAADLRRLT
jgi:hypothetical protein